MANCGLEETSDGAHLLVKLLVVTVASAAVLTCAPVREDGAACYDTGAANGTAYVVRPDRATAKGVAVDTSGQAVRLESVDCIVDALERCLNTSVGRDCLTVKIAPDWSWSACTRHQQFSCNAPANACGGTCPCACAGIVQDGNVAVTTPDLSSLAHELTHVITRVGDPIPSPYDYCATITAADCSSR